MSTKITELVWLMKHCVPVPGERRAAIESWRNALADAGMMPNDASREIEAAQSIWSLYPWRNNNGGIIR